MITITAPHIDKVAAATAAFSANVDDPKAGIITTYNFLLGQVSLIEAGEICAKYNAFQPGISQILFYDAPTPPVGIFDDFLAIPHFTKDIKTRSFTSHVQASPANVTTGQRYV